MEFLLPQPDCCTLLPFHYMMYGTVIMKCQHTDTDNRAVITRITLMLVQPVLDMNVFTHRKQTLKNLID